MAADDGLPIIAFGDAAEFEAWLEANHAGSRGLWLKVAKAGSGIPSVKIQEALDLALCFGWIDSRREGLDDQFYLQRYTPRQPRGRWSRNNREKVEQLIAEGRMRPAGLAEVERAKADGRWDGAYEGSRTATVPEDLQAELDARPEAKAFFESLNSANRYAILYRLAAAKRPETRARRLATFVAMLEAGETIYG